MKKYLPLFLSVFVLSVLFSTSINAQSAGLNFTLGFPSGDFKDNVKRTGIGGNLEGLLWMQSSVPFGIGLNLGFYNYGSETRREPFSLTVPDVTVDVDRSNNIVNFHLLFRITTNNTKARPYLDLLFGGAYIFTETKIYSRSNSEEVAGSTNFDDFAWSYGIGGGIMYKLMNLPGNNAEGYNPLYLDFKVRYIYGTEAEYLKQGSVTVQNGKVYYNTIKSKTDLLTVGIGVIMYF